MNLLYLIPARAGSKGLPGKNTKILNGKSLIEYSIEFALNNMRGFDDLCISTNDTSVFEICEKKGISIPFTRPDELSSDTATSHDVILHALNHYRAIGKEFDSVMLLQPTSPFRIKSDFDRVVQEFTKDCDMVVTVKQSKENPYFTLFEENKDGFLFKCKSGDFPNRQSAPPVYVYNGSIYLIKTTAIRNNKLQDIKKIRKVLMPEERSIDIDTPADWALAEYYSNQDK